MGSRPHITHVIVIFTGLFLKGGGKGGMIQNVLTPFQQLLLFISHSNLLRPTWFHKHVSVFCFSAYLSIYLQFYFFCSPCESKISRYHLHLLFWDVYRLAECLFLCIVIPCLHNTHTYVFQYTIHTSYIYLYKCTNSQYCIYNLPISCPNHLYFIYLCIH